MRGRTFVFFLGRWSSLGKAYFVPLVEFSPECREVSRSCSHCGSEVVAVGVRWSLWSLSELGCSCDKGWSVGFR